MKFKIAMLALLSATFSVLGQDINDYKYVLVPKTFDFLKRADQYEVNSLTKFLFEKYGFEAFMEGEALPRDLNQGVCNTLYPNLEESGFLSTKITMTLKNCQGELIYTSPTGRSKIKEYRGAYHDALRKAFVEFEEGDMAYEYNGGQAVKESLANVSAEGGKEMQEVIAVSNVEIAENKGTAVVQPSSKPTMASKLQSTDGTFILKASGTGYDVFEGTVKIGSIIKSQSGSYFVDTEQFTGVGYMDGDNFIIERQIKGIDGLVKMVFEPKN